MFLENLANISTIIWVLISLVSLFVSLFILKNVQNITINVDKSLKSVNSTRQKSKWDWNKIAWRDIIN